MNQNENLSLEELKDKKSALTEQMKELQAKIAKIGYTKNAVYQSRQKLNNYLLVERDKLVHEYNEVQKEVININKFIRKLTEQDDNFRDVCKELLGEKHYKELVEEVTRRQKGEKPFKISIDTENSKFLRDKIELMSITLKEYHDTLIKSRNEISNYVDLHYPEDHNEQIKFMTNFSKINTSIQQNQYYLTKKRVVGY